MEPSPRCPSVEDWPDPGIGAIHLVSYNLYIQFCIRKYPLYVSYILSPVERPQCRFEREGALDLDGKKLNDWIRVRNRTQALPSFGAEAEDGAGAEVMIVAGRENENAGA